tara:strand:+ start:44 stop:229 length:186 start_codon:yes stop_codon:yes gene_type:complete
MKKPNITSVHYFAEILADNLSHLVRVRKSKFNEAYNDAEGTLSTREEVEGDVKKIILQASA